MKLNEELVAIIFLFSISISAFVFIFTVDKFYHPDENKSELYKYFIRTRDTVLGKKIKAGIVGISTLVMGVWLLLKYLKN